MHVPTEDELAAIAVAYLALLRTQQPPPQPPVSRWRQSARVLDPDDLARPRRRDAGRSR